MYFRNTTLDKWIVSDKLLDLFQMCFHVTWLFTGWKSSSLPESRLVFLVVLAAISLQLHRKRFTV